MTLKPSFSSLPYHDIETGSGDLGLQRNPKPLAPNRRRSPLCLLGPQLVAPYRSSWRSWPQPVRRRRQEQKQHHRVQGFGGLGGSGFMEVECRRDWVRSWLKRVSTGPDLQAVEFEGLWGVGFRVSACSPGHALSLSCCLCLFRKLLLLCTHRQHSRLTSI